MRKQIAAANWKMNCTLQQAIDLIDGLIKENISIIPDREVVIAVPFPYLILAKEKLKNRNGFKVAAQNCYTQSSGAFTGEVSTVMLNSIGIDYVIIGHSERREIFGEDNKMLSQKVDICLTNNLKPIFCCGEPLQIRENETQNEYVEKQIRESLFHLESAQLENFVVAYEPIWAIGTGKTASSQQAQEMQAHIRNIFKEKYGGAIAASISILYGGSVKANNAKEIFEKPDVDGGLVGGASLVVAEFATIIKSLK
ncbi:triose-phosphate isomerase [Ginsengibacter hankyongi]|uniref:Triosephosphate isomerase n=1 Tax=Ginsengibacter hankyongi TaxID=2607284 RepID=A0A5J5IEQ2_9BACT|nr:triose-phosphate isomerase [Ginsengibacter hankyongi]KAA9036636.1 triose-phosphate isomerase [Ginsengibacter hankyongi]